MTDWSQKRRRHLNSIKPEDLLERTLELTEQMIEHKKKFESWQTSTHEKLALFESELKSFKLADHSDDSVYECDNKEKKKELQKKLRDFEAQIKADKLSFEVTEKYLQDELDFVTKLNTLVGLQSLFPTLNNF